jgi:hypothetical protein
MNEFKTESLEEDNFFRKYDFVKLLVRESVLGFKHSGITSVINYYA